MTEFILHGGRADGRVVNIHKARIGTPLYAPIDKPVVVSENPLMMVEAEVETYKPFKVSLFGTRVILYCADGYAEANLLSEIQIKAIIEILGGYRA